MTEYIDRETAKAFLTLLYGDTAQDCIDSISAADVAPVIHAHWDDVEVIECEAAQLMVASMRCSACNRYHNEIYHYGNPTEMAHYCGLCGAKMDVKMPKGCKTIPLRRREDGRKRGRRMRLTWRRADGAVCPRVEKGTDCDYIAGEFTQKVYDKLAAYEDAEEQGLLVRLPCKVGDTVYRICPKCNKNHDGSCANCAWQGTGGIGGCMVFGMWGDGSYPADKCTIVPWKACWNNMETIMHYINKRIFLTREEAEAALKGEKDDV